MRERDSREEDKEEGRGLGEGLFVLRKIGNEEEERNSGREGRGGGIWKNKLFWETFMGALLLLGNLASRARKPQRFLELGSQRGCS